MARNEVRYLVFDIETAADAALVAKLRELAVHGRSARGGRRTIGPS